MKYDERVEIETDKFLKLFDDFINIKTTKNIEKLKDIYNKLLKIQPKYIRIYDSVKRLIRKTKGLIKEYEIKNEIKETKNYDEKIKLANKLGVRQGKKEILNSIAKKVTTPVKKFVEYYTIKHRNGFKKAIKKNAYPKELQIKNNHWIRMDLFEPSKTYDTDLWPETLKKFNPRYNYVLDDAPKIRKISELPKIDNKSKSILSDVVDEFDQYENEYDDYFKEYSGDVSIGSVTENNNNMAAMSVKKSYDNRCYLAILEHKLFRIKNKIKYWLDTFGQTKLNENGYTINDIINKLFKPRNIGYTFYDKLGGVIFDSPDNGPKIHMEVSNNHLEIIRKPNAINTNETTKIALCNCKQSHLSKLDALLCKYKNKSTKVDFKQITQLINQTDNDKIKINMTSNMVSSVIINKELYYMPPQDDSNKLFCKFKKYEMSKDCEYQQTKRAIISTKNVTKNHTQIDVQKAFTSVLLYGRMPVISLLDKWELIKPDTDLTDCLIRSNVYIPLFQISKNEVYPSEYLKIIDLKPTHFMRTKRVSIHNEISEYIKKHPDFKLTINALVGLFACKNKTVFQKTEVFDNDSETELPYFKSYGYNVLNVGNKSIVQRKEEIPKLMNLKPWFNYCYDMTKLMTIDIYNQLSNFTVSGFYVDAVFIKKAYKKKTLQPGHNKKTNDDDNDNELYLHPDELLFNLEVKNKCCSRKKLIELSNIFNDEEEEREEEEEHEEEHEELKPIKLTNNVFGNNKYGNYLLEDKEILDGVLNKINTEKPPIMPINNIETEIIELNKGHNYELKYKPNSIVFIDAVAGSGKTTLINKFCETNNDVLRLAYTNCASNLINGKTIHRGLQLNDDGSYTISNRYKTIIIDEYSMIPRYLLEIILNTRNTRMLIIAGESKQLPPVKEEDFNLLYTGFTPNLLIKMDFSYRFSDEYTEYCKKIRDGKIKIKNIQITKDYKIKNDDLIICCFNKQIDEYNNKYPIDRYIAHTKTNDLIKGTILKVKDDGECDETLITDDNFSHNTIQEFENIDDNIRMMRGCSPWKLQGQTIKNIKVVIDLNSLIKFSKLVSRDMLRKLIYVSMSRTENTIFM